MAETQTNGYGKKSIWQWIIIYIIIGIIVYGLIYYFVLNKRGGYGGGGTSGQGIQQNQPGTRY